MRREGLSEELGMVDTEIARLANLLKGVDGQEEYVGITEAVKRPVKGDLNLADSTARSNLDLIGTLLPK